MTNLLPAWAQPGPAPAAKHARADFGPWWLLPAEDEVQPTPPPITPPARRAPRIGPDPLAAPARRASRIDPARLQRFHDTVSAMADEYESAVASFRAHGGGKAMLSDADARYLRGFRVRAIGKRYLK